MATNRTGGTLLDALIYALGPVPVASLFAVIVTLALVGIDLALLPPAKKD